MANTPISGFTSGAPAQSTDELVIARSGANFKLTADNVLALFVSTANTFTAAQTITDIANPLVPSLSVNAGSNITGTAITGVQITGTAGQFSCTAAALSVGQLLTISGTLGGTGSITGYANPTTYRISVTNGSTTFTLVNNTTGAALTTTAGTPTGLTYTLTSPGVNVSQTWNNSAVAFTGLRYNVTDTASATASLLIDLQVGGVTQFNLTKAGVLNVRGNILPIPDATSNLGSAANRMNNIFFSTAVRGTANATFDWTDLILRRRAAANLQLGAADAAAPVAQTLSVQSVVAGTTNTAGTNLTVNGSIGTGTGAGGSLIFQVAPAGSSGSAQNALVAALTIASNQTVIAGAAFTVATLPAAGTQGRRAWVTDATVPTFLGTLTGGGAVVCPVFDNGTAWVSA